MEKLRVIDNISTRADQHHFVGAQVELLLFLGQKIRRRNLRILLCQRRFKHRLAVAKICAVELIDPPAVGGAHKADGVLDGINVHVLRGKGGVPVSVVVGNQGKRNGIVGGGFQAVGIGAAVHHGAGQIVHHGA